MAVECIADRVLAMCLGKIVGTGSATEAFSRLIPTRALLDSIPVPAQRKRLRPLEDEAPSPLNPPAGCVFHPRFGRASSRCSEVAPTLESYDTGRPAASFHGLIKEP